MQPILRKPMMHVKYLESTCDDIVDNLVVWYAIKQQWPQSIRALAYVLYADGLKV